MHPILGNRWRLALYLAAWVLVGLLLAVLLRAAAPWPVLPAVLQAVPMAILYGFMCLSAWWVCRAAPLGRTSPWRTIVALVGAASVATVSWALLGTQWARIVFAVAGRIGASASPGSIDTWIGRTGPPGATASFETLRAGAFLVFLAAGIPSYLFSALVHYLIIAFEASRAAERRALESQVVARDAELRALRAQLNPHFLFNSLNSINALVGSDPEAARRMCERLGDFLRQTLALATRETVPLGEELALVERYLAIEKVRFGDRLESRIRATPEARACAVPPLLLQPLVENAVKHGITARLEGGLIEIDAVRDGDALHVRLSNPYDEDGTSERGEGVGLENVRRRLRAIDARRSQLTATRDRGRFQVELSLGVEPGPTGEGRTR